MEIRPEDIDAIMSGSVAGDVQCFHESRIGIVPGPDGPMFVLRIISHGKPDGWDGDTVPTEFIKVTNYGLYPHELADLTEKSIEALLTATAITGSEN